MRVMEGKSCEQGTKDLNDEVVAGAENTDTLAGNLSRRFTE